MPQYGQKGFTLIELMVVLIIVGIASAAVSISIKPDPQQRLRKDANRLVQLLQIAQAEAQVDGRPITLESDGKGFHFSRRSDQGFGFDHFTQDPHLHPRTWETPALKISVTPKQRVILNGEWFNPPIQLALSDGRNTLAVQRTADGQIRVVSEP